MVSHPGFNALQSRHCNFTYHYHRRAISLVLGAGTTSLESNATIVF
jgi:hypothetical protein